jgi:preprotein translocase subunit YajC
MAAGSTAQAAQPDGTFSLVMIAAIFVLFYFMLIRPQNKRAKEQREMVGNLKKGDEIMEKIQSLINKQKNTEEPVEG